MKRSLLLASGFAALLAAPAFSQSTTPTSPSNPTPSSPTMTTPNSGTSSGNGARAWLDHQHCADQRHHHDHGLCHGMWYTAPITTGQHRASDLINQSVITAPTSASVR